MARILLVLLAACSNDIATSHDAAANGDAGIDLAETCGLGGACGVPVDQLCTNFEAVCACLDGHWDCCNPQIYTCPPQVHTGDYCCPLGFSPTGNSDQQCGCRCVAYRYVCDLDGGTRD